METTNHNKPRRRSDRHKKNDDNTSLHEKEKPSNNDAQSEPTREATPRRSNKHKDKQKNNDKHFFIFRRIAIAVAAIFVFALIAYTLVLYGGRLIADNDKLIITEPTTVETTEGDVLWYIYNEYRLPVKIEEIPEHVQKAFVAIEDKRFYSHNGVDLRSIMRAVYRDIVARNKKEGASTITQQLAKNVFLTNDKTWWRKIKEAMIALHLEREYSKEEILEKYLNVIYFGQGQYGVEAASNRFFNKSVSDLTIEEGALLAGIIKAPNGYSPVDHVDKAQQRRDLVLQTMYESEYITEEEMESAKQKGIDLTITPRKINPAYHTIADLAVKEAESEFGISFEELKEKRYRIVTSVDKTIQEIVYEQFQLDKYFPGNNMDNVEGAFVMLEEGTGSIVAAMGGRKYERGNLNRILEKRQPGSTMKPIAVYAPALELGEFTPFSMLPDELGEWDGHQVRNHDDRYDGTVSLYDALKKSKNTTAYWLLNEIGIKKSKQFLSKMDLQIEDEGLAIALGGLKTGLTPLQLAEAYRTFLHQGEKVNGHLILEVYDNKNRLVGETKVENKQVFSEQVAWTMTEMLKDVVNNGTAQAGYYPYELAGKTGTTQHVNAAGKTKDAWFVGFTPEYVTALWMGYDVSDENHYLTGGSSYPTEMTKKILTEIHGQEPLVETFTKPEHVQALAEPIELPQINNLEGSYAFGGLKLVKGKLVWASTDDPRIIYHIYEQNGDAVERIGEVLGEEQFVIDQFILFKQRSYYVVPYNPLTGEEGQQSNIVQIP